MYKSIYDMAINLGLEPTPGFRKKLVKAHIILDKLGNYQRIELFTDDKLTLCPDKPFKLKGFTGNYSAQFLADYALVVLYSPGLSKDKEDKYATKHKNYVNQIKMGSDEGITLLTPISIFLDRYDTDPNLREDILRDLDSTSLKIASDILSFRVDLMNSETDPGCLDYYKKMAELLDEEASHPKYIIQPLQERKYHRLREHFRCGRVVKPVREFLSMRVL